MMACSDRRSAWVTGSASALKETPHGSAGSRPHHLGAGLSGSQGDRQIRTLRIPGSDLCHTPRTIFDH